jgi:hypothetical protein
MTIRSQLENLDACFRDVRIKLLNRPFAIKNVVFYNKMTTYVMALTATAVRAIVNTNYVNTLR